MSEDAEPGTIIVFTNVSRVGSLFSAEIVKGNDKKMFAIIATVEGILIITSKYFINRARYFVNVPQVVTDICYTIDVD